MNSFIILSVFGVFLQKSSCFEMTLLHVNDIHVKIEETNKYSSTCKPADKEAGKCYGGVARLSQAVKDIKKTTPNVLWLNAGDFYQGTIWYTQFKWKAVSLFNNLLNFDAMTLGNHEFDDKIAGLLPFLQNQSCPIVVSNINTSLVPSMTNLTRPSLKIKMDDKIIGIVGYITPDTKHIANPEDVIFIDEVEALKPEVSKLHDEGVDIIMALGHSGYVKDQEVAAKVPHLDVVIGAHSHSFLFTPTSSVDNPSINPIRGPYPTIIDNPAGHKTLVLQAYAFTKYLGQMKLKFSDAGHLESWSGSPILLDSSYPQDPDILRQMEPWQRKLEQFRQVRVGEAAVLLDVSRDRESRLGNFVADAMVASWRGKTVSNKKVRLALLNSGGIRAAIDAGNVTLEDLLTTFPFSNTFDVVTLPGKALREMFEHSVSEMTSDGRNGGGVFLQMSGFHVVYDVRKEVGDRVVSAKAICDDCDDDTYEDLADDEVYNIVASNYVISGGDGYTMIEDTMLAHVIGGPDLDIIKKTFEDDSPVSADIENRIEIITITNGAPTPYFISTLEIVTPVIGTLVTMLVV